MKKLYTTLGDVMLRAENRQLIEKNKKLKQLSAILCVVCAVLLAAIVARW